MITARIKFNMKNEPRNMRKMQYIAAKVGLEAFINYIDSQKAYIVHYCGPAVLCDDLENSDH